MSEMIMIFLALGNNIVAATQKIVNKSIIGPQPSRAFASGPDTIGVVDGKKMTLSNDAPLVDIHMHGKAQTAKAFMSGEGELRIMMAVDVYAVGVGENHLALNGVRKLDMMNLMAINFESVFGMTSRPRNANSSVMSPVTFLNMMEGDIELIEMFKEMMAPRGEPTIVQGASAALMVQGTVVHGNHILADAVTIVSRENFVEGDQTHAIKVGLVDHMAHQHPPDGRNTHDNANGRSSSIDMLAIDDSKKAFVGEVPHHHVALNLLIFDALNQATTRFSLQGKITK